jgi:hypothetical protein
VLNEARGPKLTEATVAGIEGRLREVDALQHHRNFFDDNPGIEAILVDGIPALAHDAEDATPDVSASLRLA